MKELKKIKNILKKSHNLNLIFIFNKRLYILDLRYLIFLKEKRKNKYELSIIPNFGIFEKTLFKQRKIKLIKIEATISEYFKKRELSLKYINVH